MSSLLSVLPPPTASHRSNGGGAGGGGGSQQRGGKGPPKPDFSALRADDATKSFSTSTAPALHQSQTQLQQRNQHALQSLGMTAATQRQQQPIISTRNTNAIVQYNRDNPSQIDVSRTLLEQHLQPGQLVQYSLAHTKAKADQMSAEELALPDDSVVEATREKTAAALGQIVDQKTASGRSTYIAKQDTSVQYIKYTPANSVNGGVGQRLIRMQHAAVDPLEPPRHRHQRLPQQSDEAPVPILHSPPRQLTNEEAKEWKIPPSISQWKNPKGYIIALDKRLAADGHELQQPTINSRFNDLSDAMLNAERQARADIEKRSELLRQLEERRREEKEQELQELARKAREQLFASSTSERDTSSVKREPAYDTSSSDESDDGNGVAERDQMRRQTQQQIRRQMQQEQRRSEQQSVRNRERDVSERIALGQEAGPAGRSTADVQFDSRLFNQAESMGAGFGGEDSYNVYDKPLLQGSSINQLYRPSANMAPVDDEPSATAVPAKTRASAPDRGFAGTEGHPAARQARTAPVEFQRGETDIIGEQNVLSDEQQAELERQQRQAEEAAAAPAVSSSVDPFNVQRLMDAAKQHKKQQQAEQAADNAPQHSRRHADRRSPSHEPADQSRSVPRVPDDRYRERASSPRSNSRRDDQSSRHRPEDEHKRRDDDAYRSTRRYDTEQPRDADYRSRRDYDDRRDRYDNRDDRTHRSTRHERPSRSPPREDRRYDDRRYSREPDDYRRRRDDYDGRHDDRYEKRTKR